MLDLTTREEESMLNAKANRHPLISSLIFLIVFIAPLNAIQVSDQDAEFSYKTLASQPKTASSERQPFYVPDLNRYIKSNSVGISTSADGNTWTLNLVRPSAINLGTDGRIVANADVFDYFIWDKTQWIKVSELPKIGKVADTELDESLQVFTEGETAIALVGPQSRLYRAAGSSWSQWDPIDIPCKSIRNLALARNRILLVCTRDFLDAIDQPNLGINPSFESVNNGKSWNSVGNVDIIYKDEDRFSLYPRPIKFLTSPDFSVAASTKRLLIHSGTNTSWTDVTPPTFDGRAAISHSNIIATTKIGMFKISKDLGRTWEFPSGTTDLRLSASKRVTGLFSNSQYFISFVSTASPDDSFSDDEEESEVKPTLMLVSSDGGDKWKELPRFRQSI